MILNEYGRGKDLIITCDVPRCFSLLGQLPGRKRWEDRKLVMESSGANIAFILAHWPDAKWYGRAEEALESYLKVKMEEENTRQVKVTASQRLLPDTSGYEHKTKPFAHQHNAFVMSRDRMVFALFHEPGCGKSKVIIDTVAYLWEHKKVDTFVIVAPNNVHRNWIFNEIPAHMPARIPRWCGHYSASLSPRKLNELVEAATTIHDRLRIIAFNVEGFVSEKAQKLRELFLREGKALEVVDESSRIKNPSAQRTKYLVKTAHLAKYRRIATGTPITKGAENYFSQFAYLDKKILGYDSFWTYREHFCIMGGFENRMIVAYKNLDELTRTVDGHSHRVLKKDCLDLPEKIYKRHPFELSKQQREIYDAIRRNSLELLTKVLGEKEGDRRANEISVVRMLRLLQVCCGWVPEGDTGSMVAIPGPTPRLDALETICEDVVEEKAIIWCRFKQDVRSVLRLFPAGTAVDYFGDTKNSARDGNVNLFQKSARVRWLVGTPQAGGIGLTMTAGQDTIYYSNSHDLEQRLQSEDRNNRIGATGKLSGYHTLYTDLEAIKTLERQVVVALQKKKSIADQLNKDPRSLFMEE